MWFVKMFVNTYILNLVPLKKLNVNATGNFPFLDKMSLFLTDQYQVCNKIVKFYPVTRWWSIIFIAIAVATNSTGGKLFKIGWAQFSKGAGKGQPSKNNLFFCGGCPVEF